ncbi:MAG: DNA helicase UvrD [Elusimicrobia bacterium]|nr:DNA helicase UvrD [Elusimicrobiota bacterium]
MKFIADLHIHSHLSRACSKDLKPESLYKWCQLKGITALTTGDFTHPAWNKELQEKLEPAEPGLFTLKKELAQQIDPGIPPSCGGPIRFLLGVEISSIYKKNGRVRKIHNLVFTPSFETAKKINARLEKIGNIRSDGRPILGLDSKDLLAILLDISPENYLIPAHAWTPHFAVFGSESGFDSLEECFDDLTPHIFAIETGLSSDPPMNWRLSALDNITLISNSDAHSPEKLGREGNLLEAPLSYQGVFDALKKKNGAKLLKTLEFFPEEGKYHVDGHRNCKTRLEPEETLKLGGLCPVCQKPVTVGVLHRVAKLADRKTGQKPVNTPDFENIVPLKEIIGETLRVGPSSKRVDEAYWKLLGLFGPEFSILREVPTEQLQNKGFPLLALAINRMRQAKAKVLAGYDGEYGKISFLEEKDFRPSGELALF